METILASSLAKVMSAASLAKAGGRPVLGSVLAGLKSAGFLPSSVTLGLAALALKPWLGTLHSSCLLELPAEALTTYLLGDDRALNDLAKKSAFAGKGFGSGKAVAMVIGGAVAVGAVPVVLGALGFTGAGITASSIAAKMMSAAAIANGGQVAAGSLVATLQSIGAAGLSLWSKIILGSTGSALASFMI